MSNLLNYTSDEELKGSIWEKQIENLRDHVFKNQWQIYALCVSIGIMHDKQLDFEKDKSETKMLAIPRNMLTRYENHFLLEFMFQTAILTSRLVDFSEDDRMALAFDEDCQIEFDKRKFLTRFANYGISELDRVLEGKDVDLEKMEALKDYFSSACEEGIFVGQETDLFEEILESI